jgi:hypothetical protein
MSNVWYTEVRRTCLIWTAVVGNLPHKIGGIVRQNGAYYPITAVSFSLFINSRSMHA